MRRLCLESLASLSRGARQLPLTPVERRGALIFLLALVIGQVRTPLQPIGFADVAAPAPVFPIDLQHATEADLQVLPGVGPVLAARIVANRASQGGFDSVEALVGVPGIGPVRLAALRPLVCVSLEKDSNLLENGRSQEHAQDIGNGEY